MSRAALRLAVTYSTGTWLSWRFSRRRKPINSTGTTRAFRVVLRRHSPAAMTKSSGGIPNGTAGAGADVRGFYEKLWIFLPPRGEKVIWMSTRCFVGVPGTDGCAENDWALRIHKETGEWRCDGCHAHGELRSSGWSSSDIPEHSGIAETPPCKP